MHKYKVGAMSFNQSGAIGHKKIFRGPLFMPKRIGNLEFGLRQSQISNVFRYSIL